MRPIHPHISRPYAVINWIFVLIIAGIFVYSAAYDPDRANHIISSGYQVLTGESTISTGLSRSFSALVRFRFADAKEYNPYGLRIFLFFVVQLILRATILFLILRGIWRTGRMLFLADALQSLLLFIICFWPFLLYWKDIL